MTVTAQDIETVGAAITLADDGSNLDAIDTLLDDVNTAAAAFGAAQIRIEAQSKMLTSSRSTR